MIKIYTDGGCSGNPGPGGWAFLILTETFQGPKVLREGCGGEKMTTNNRMEITAVISALETFKRLRQPRKAEILTDSQYVKLGITEWIHNWKKNNWKNSDKEPVKNKDLWLKLEEAAAMFSLSWTWVKGHSGDPYNERCDKLTQKAIAAL